MTALLILAALSIAQLIGVGLAVFAFAKLMFRQNGYREGGE